MSERNVSCNRMQFICVNMSVLMAGHFPCAESVEKDSWT